MTDDQLPITLPGYEIEEPERSILGLYPFQVVGRDYLQARSRALLADDMGVGKTVQLLAALKGEPVLIVSPVSVVGVWEREAAKWRPDYKVTVAIPKLTAFPRPGEMVILPKSRLPTHPALLKKRAEAAKKKADKAAGIVEVAWPGMARSQSRHVREEDPFWRGIHANTTLGIDEVHHYRNPKAIVTQDLTVLTRGPARIWGLTGTPLMNYATDLLQVLTLLGLDKVAYPGGLGEFRKLYGAVLEEYYRGGEVKKAWVWKEPPPELQEHRLAAVARISLRRTKEEVAPWLPKKRREFIEIKLDNPSDFWTEISDMTHDIDVERALKNPSSLEAKSLFAARAMLAMEKMDAALEIVENYEANREPLIVFSAHRVVVETVGRRQGWGRILGGTPKNSRDALCAAFQEGNLRGLAATIKTAGEGLTLTKSANVLFVDRDWNAQLNRQAEDRAYRIGQTRPVRVMILVTSHPIDKRVEDIISKKEALVRATFINPGSGT